MKEWKVETYHLPKQKATSKTNIIKKNKVIFTEPCQKIDFERRNLEAAERRKTEEN